MFYNALQGSLNKRFSNGFNFLASYTLAHNLGNADGNVGAAIQDAHHPEREYGPVLPDLRHRFVVSYIYELPVGRGRHLDRKSTRLNSSHGYISYAVFCLKKKKISISSLQTHNVNRCGRSRHLARKLSLRRKRSSPNVFEMAATETITSIILIKLIRVSLGTVRHPRRFKIVVIDIQITLKQMLRDFFFFFNNRANNRGLLSFPTSLIPQ